MARLKQEAYVGDLRLPVWLLGRLLYYAYADDEKASWGDIERQHGMPDNAHENGRYAQRWARAWADQEGMSWPPCHMETPRMEPQIAITTRRR